MPRNYFSSRTGKKNITIFELHARVASAFVHFHQKDFFKERLKINLNDSPSTANTLANALLGIEPFPLDSWKSDDVTEENIFDVLEFLFDHISKPGKWGEMFTETGFGYSDYLSYDQLAGQEEFANLANVFLADYGVGYELLDGQILALPSGGLEKILSSEILEYDEENVDNKVRNAIIKWRNRKLSWDIRRESIRDLADVFEWLKKNRDLGKVIANKDSSALFEIANNFAIRHHEPRQKSNYEKEIWYPWIFHFYLATYHATIRLLTKAEK